MSINRQVEAWDLNAQAWRDLIESSADPNHDNIILPALERALGDVSRRKIIDLGCGEGSLCRFLRRKGADVSGIDFSENMIRIAKTVSPELDIDYKVCAIHEVASAYPKHVFDIAIANMSLFCVENLESAVAAIQDVVTPNGRFVFSILHPCFDLRIYKTSSRTVAHRTFNNPERIMWPRESYFNVREKYRKIKPEFPSETAIFVRMLEQYSSVLRDNGFLIDAIYEPRPTSDIANDTTLLSHEMYKVFPLFLIMSATKAHPNWASPLSSLQNALNFRRDRDWEKFQTPKNLAIAVILEAAELLEHFHWLDDSRTVNRYLEEKGADIRDELADIYINVQMLAHDLNISLEEAANEKIRSLRGKYRVLQVKGRHINPSDKRRTISPARTPEKAPSTTRRGRKK